MIGLLFKIVLIAIFIYLIYRIFFANGHHRNGGGGDADIHGRGKNSDPVQKRIDKSKVEDADYKEVD